MARSASGVVVMKLVPAAVGGYGLDSAAVSGRRRPVVVEIHASRTSTHRRWFLRRGTSAVGTGFGWFAGVLRGEVGWLTPWFVIVVVFGVFV